MVVLAGAVAQLCGCRRRLLPGIMHAAAGAPGLLWLLAAAPLRFKIYFGPNINPPPIPLFNPLQVVVVVLFGVCFLFFCFSLFSRSIIVNPNLL